MYRYDEVDQKLVDERVAQFRDQTRRYLAGSLGEDEFKQLRLRNGLYYQLHAPMLRVAIPYGLLSSEQLRRLAYIARTWDRGYGHFTTRQNLQFNWPRVEDVPDILAELAKVQMHAIQTSGNCIRNVTSDPLAGVAPDELADPRPYCEIIRQWSTFHPEFSWLPRKFKIAVTGSPRDRAASQVHDIGLHLKRDANGAPGFEVLVGGGLGRTPIIGHVIRGFLPQAELLAYLESIMRVHNRHGRRDNPNRARIKILVKSLGPEAFAEQVEQEYRASRDTAPTLAQAEVDRVAGHFSPPPYRPRRARDPGLHGLAAAERAFASWLNQNTRAHRVSGYRSVYLSLKAPGRAPGDLDADEMDLVADLADRFSFGELRVTHEQNLVLADVAERDLHALWRQTRDSGLAHANIGTVTDMICCPGLDYCSLANARSIPVAHSIHQRFEDLDYLHDLGEIRINMSGCMNACGHHHVGHIGILGVSKHGEEWYQLTIGGSSREDASLGKVIGPSVPAHEVADTVAMLLSVYVHQREDGERFIDTVRRIGVEPFRRAVYDWVREEAEPAREVAYG